MTTTPLPLSIPKPLRQREMCIQVLYFAGSAYPALVKEYVGIMEETYTLAYWNQYEPRGMVCLEKLVSNYAAYLRSHGYSTAGLSS